MARGTAETVQTSPPPAQLATAGSASFSAMTETAPVPTSCVTATGTATMAPMRTLCCVVGFISELTDFNLNCLTYFKTFRISFFFL